MRPDPNRNLNFKRSLLKAPTSPLLDELAGYMELGMHRKAISLARRILKRKKISSQEFTEALDILLSMQSHLEDCAELVEEAHQRFKGPDRKKVRLSMLSFYYSVGDYAAALPYTSRQPQSAVEFMLSLDTFIKLEMDHEALKLAKKSQRMILECESALDHGSIFSALGKFFAQRGAFDAALTAWTSVPIEVAVGFSKFESIVKIHAARTIHCLQEGLKELKALESQGDSQMEISYPGLHRKLVREARNELKAYARGLEMIVPKDEKAEFGL